MSWQWLWLYDAVHTRAELAYLSELHAAELQQQQFQAACRQHLFTARQQLEQTAALAVAYPLSAYIAAQVVIHRLQQAGITYARLTEIADKEYLRAITTLAAQIQADCARDLSTAQRALGKSGVQAALEGDLLVIAHQAAYYQEQLRRTRGYGRPYHASSVLWYGIGGLSVLAWSCLPLVLCGSWLFLDVEAGLFWIALALLMGLPVCAGSVFYWRRRARSRYHALQTQRAAWQQALTPLWPDLRRAEQVFGGARAARVWEQELAAREQQLRAILEQQ